MNKFSVKGFIVLVVLLSTLSLVSCGTSPSESLEKSYMLSVPTQMEGIGWYNVDDYTLELLADDNYRLLYKTDIFGGSDMIVKGVRTLSYWGKYSSAASADGETSHLDIQLEPAERILFEQHGKRWGRGADILTGELYIDTANWTELMTQLYDAENVTKGAEDFLAQYAKPMTVTIEDPTLQPEDTTLVYRIVEAPEFQF